MTTSVALLGPKVGYVSSAESQFDAMMTWRAELELTYLDEGHTPDDVLAGYADFLTIRIGEHPVADLLDSLSQDACHFAGLFERYCQDLWMRLFQATSVSVDSPALAGVMSVGRSSSLPL
jgi:hypothetical protein